MQTKLELLLTLDRAWAVDAHFATGAISALSDIPGHLNLSGRPDPQSYVDDYNMDLDEPSAGRPYRIDAAGRAAIEISGPMMKKPTSADEVFGGACCTLDVRRQLRMAARDPRVTSIGLIIDSPGGQVSGTAELADDVARAAAVKEVVAYVDGRAFSAAYWVASAASRIVCSPHGEVGSIGVFTVAYDTTEHAEKQGVHARLITSGGVKGQGSYGVPLSDEAVEEWQQHVMGCYDRFVDAVAENRSMARDDVLALATGRTFTADEALRAGLVDEIRRWGDLSATATVPEGTYVAEAPSGGEATANEMDFLKNLFRSRGEASAEEDQVRLLAATVVERHVEAKLADYKDLAPAALGPAATLYVAALAADGGGTPQLNGNGQVVEGEAVAALRALLAEVKPVATLKEQIVSRAVEAAVLPDLSEKGSDYDARVDRYRRKAGLPVGGNK